METTEPRIAIADDHNLIRIALAEMLEKMGYNIVFQAKNGDEIVEYVRHHPLDLILMDINMKPLNGWKATEMCLQINPSIRVIALTYVHNELSVIQMFRAGVKGYILKDALPSELSDAIQIVKSNEFYLSSSIDEMINIDVTQIKANSRYPLTLTEKESTFIKYACTDLAYKEIAEKMFVSIRSVDGYRNAVFEKLRVKTRIGVALYAIKTGMVEF